jgi:acyl-homoserine lactone synthase
MIEVVTSRNALLYQDALEDAYGLRHDMLVPALVGPPDAVPGGRDRYDTADALYLLLTRDDGVVVAAARLLPTLRPHGLSEIAPEFCSVRGVQRGHKILELNASGADMALFDPAIRARAHNHLFVGVFEFCLRAGFEHLTMLVPTDQLFHLLLLGLSIKPLGLPVDRDGTWQVAVMVAVDHAAFDVVRLAFDVPRQRVDYVGAPSGDPLVLAPLVEREQRSAAA